MNLTKMEEFLTVEISAEMLAKELDDAIFDFVCVYGVSDGEISPATLAHDIYMLKLLRDIFKEIS